MMYMSMAQLKSGERGGTGALAAFLAGASDHIGQAHHLVWSLFGDKGGKRPFLYRMTGSGTSQPILIYSEEKPEDRHGLWTLDSKPFTLADNLKDGDRVAWSLRVNATVKVENKRLDIVNRARLQGDSDPIEVVAAKVVPPWLERKLEGTGLRAAASEMMVEAYTRRRFVHDPRRRADKVTIATTDVRGIGTVSDARLLSEVLMKGIGSGRAYGCGMLLLRRA